LSWRFTGRKQNVLEDCDKIAKKLKKGIKTEWTVKWQNRLPGTK
jgi:hypothetical protein